MLPGECRAAPSGENLLRGDALPEVSPSTGSLVPTSARACRPTRHTDDLEDQHTSERLVAVLRVPLGKPGGEPRRSIVGVTFPAEFGPDPPQLGPIVGIPVLDEQRRLWVGLQVPLALQSCRRLRLDAVDGDGEVVAVDSEADGHRIDAPVGMSRAQDCVIVCHQPGTGLDLGELHARTVLGSMEAGRSRLVTVEAGWPTLDLVHTSPHFEQLAGLER